MVEKNFTSIFQGHFKDVVFRSVRKNIQAILDFFKTRTGLFTALCNILCIQIIIP